MGNKTFVVSSNVRSVVTEEGAVLMDIQSGSMFTVNMIGGFIWQRLAAGRSIEQIAADVSMECRAANQQEVLVDVGDFAQELEDKRLICASK